MNKEDSTPRQYNSAKAKINKAIGLLDDAAAKFNIDSLRRRQLIEARQAVEDTFEMVFGERANIPATPMFDSQKSLQVD